MKRFKVNRPRKDQAEPATAPAAEPNIDYSAGKSGEPAKTPSADHFIANSGEKSGKSTASTVAHAREFPRHKPLAPNCLLSDEVEEKICRYISQGLTWGDASRLAGLHRSTCWNWKTKGDAYLDDPEGHPEDERFAEF